MKRLLPLYIVLMSLVLGCVHEEQDTKFDPEKVEDYWVIGQQYSESDIYNWCSVRLKQITLFDNMDAYKYVMDPDLKNNMWIWAGYIDVDIDLGEDSYFEGLCIYLHNHKPYGNSKRVFIVVIDMCGHLNKVYLQRVGYKKYRCLFSEAYL